jgi:two-component system chemotaxis response regulator CheY
MDKRARDQKVLLVDDSACFRLIASDMLKEMGFASPEVAENGLEALHKLRSTNFSLIISDYQMHGMNGLDLLRIAKGDPQLKDIPFVMVSALEDGFIFESARGQGASGCISRPLHFDQFAELVGRVMV